MFDGRAFFEKALVFGVQHGILDQARLDTIANDAPKGMVQIARYFGSEFLRPEIEKAKDRIVNLVSLNLELLSGGDLAKAAQALREHSFMSRSKAASDMLKALIVMPQNTHFGMNEHGGFGDKHIPQLAKWSLCTLADYQAEPGRSRLRRRSRHSHRLARFSGPADPMARLGGVSKNGRHSARIQCQEGHHARLPQGTACGLQGRRGCRACQRASRFSQDLGRHPHPAKAVQPNAGFCGPLFLVGRRFVRGGPL
jgi:hypothetical protein